MREEDLILLECLEDVYHTFEKALKKAHQVRSIHVQKFEQLLVEISSERRIFEDISIPARLVVEQLLESQFKVGQVAIEAERLKQSFASVAYVKVEEFGIISTKIGELEVSWRDGNYSYYLYPDKVELRATDEKSSIKLFFSISFNRQTLERFPEILISPNVVYIHPQLEKWIRKV
ncbi:hypothetical protein DP73_08950 [Desulfosporosinus sp. HMP52]|uniref:Uncharacterized protein n=1 Tax=Desulfosporosinus hippei DSM 8344 TaxID=1121419 RepID=A0A1G7XP06_9FIRM|nr:MULTISPECIES: hypothetical protein [Desulfosporosinus]KGK89752.1 hypothetical protein DP73_08950 [Desulfosporosinus sp. HMP52]SDG85763.1 hypothetical protein SAMN05443529_10748 [Desulfosporosinus hippei DSM 8344]